MKLKSLFSLLVLPILSVSALSTLAIAQEFKPKEAGDFVVRVRGIDAIPNEDGDLSVGGVGIDGTVDLNDAIVPEIDFSYFFTENIAIELIAVTTVHDVKATELPGELDLGSVRLVPPTVTLQYHFMPEKRLSPYVGAGINYTFFSTHSTGGATSVKYDNSFGLAAQVGVDYALADNWSVNLDVKKLFLSTDATVNDTIKADVQVDPWIIGFGVGYRF